jgi:hypothetical protein
VKHWLNEYWLGLLLFLISRYLPPEQTKALRADLRRRLRPRRVTGQASMAATFSLHISDAIVVRDEARVSGSG